MRLCSLGPQSNNSPRRLCLAGAKICETMSAELAESESALQAKLDVMVKRDDEALAFLDKQEAELGKRSSLDAARIIVRNDSVPESTTVGEFVNRLRIRLAETEAELSILRREREKVQAKIDEMAREAASSSGSGRTDKESIDGILASAEQEIEAIVVESLKELKEVGKVSRMAAGRPLCS